MKKLLAFILAAVMLGTMAVGSFAAVITNPTSPQSKNAVRNDDLTAQGVSGVLTDEYVVTPSETAKKTGVMNFPSNFKANKGDTIHFTGMKSNMVAFLPVEGKKMFVTLVPDIRGNATVKVADLVDETGVDINDAQISKLAKAYAKGIILGDEFGKWNIKGEATVGMVLATISRALRYVNETAGKNWENKALAIVKAAGIVTDDELDLNKKVDNKAVTDLFKATLKKASEIKGKKLTDDDINTLVPQLTTDLAKSGNLTRGQVFCAAYDLEQYLENGLNLKVADMDNYFAKQNFQKPAIEKVLYVADDISK